MSLGIENRLPIAPEIIDDEHPIGLAFQAGKLVVTTRSLRSGEHITLRFRASAKVAGRWREMPYHLASHVFIDVPNTSDDGSFNDKVGTLYPPHSPMRWAGWLYPDPNADATRLWTARKVLEVVVGQAHSHVEDRYEMLLEAACLRCGLPLTDPESIQRGFGPDCYGTVTKSKHAEKVRPAAPRPAPVLPVEARAAFNEQVIRGREMTATGDLQLDLEALA